jgi:hypothetical protein
MLSRTEGRDLGSRLLHALPLQGGLPRPPAYIDVAMVDQRRRERRAFAAKCVGKAVQRIAGAFSQSGRPQRPPIVRANPDPVSGLDRPLRGVSVSTSAELTVGSTRSCAWKSLSDFSTRPRSPTPPPSPGRSGADLAPAAAYEGEGPLGGSVQPG